MFVGSLHRGTECGKNPSFGTQQEMLMPPSGTNQNQPQWRDYQHSRFSEVPWCSGWPEPDLGATSEQS